MNLASPALPDWLQAVQALMILAVVFSSTSFLVFLAQLFIISKGGLFYFTGLCQAFAGGLKVYKQHIKRCFPSF